MFSLTSLVIMVYYFSVLWEIKPLELDFTPHKGIKINLEDKFRCLTVSSLPASVLE